MSAICIHTNITFTIDIKKIFTTVIKNAKEQGLGGEVKELQLKVQELLIKSK
jgi:hypothetical protein